MISKVCSKCGEEKELSEFHIKKSMKDGRNPTCKDCRKMESEKYYDKNSEKINERISNYRSNNKSYRETNKKYRKN